MDALKTYDYLTKSRERVSVAVRLLSSEQYLRPFPFGLKSVSSTITHMMISEWYYIQRLKGLAVPPYDQWPIKEETPPAFATIEHHWREQAAHTRETIAAEHDWNRRITWHSFPNEQGKRFYITATAGEFFTQLTLHEVHHRAQILVMLRELGHPVEDLDYNALMFDRQEAP